MWLGFLCGCFLSCGAAYAAEVELARVASGLINPVFVIHSGDGTGRLFVLEQPGTIRILASGTLLETPFLDIRSIVTNGGERGLLGLAFHPDFADNRRFFVNYTRTEGGQGQTVIAEYRASASNPNLAQDEGTVVLTFDQPFTNHNGGALAFGSDGFLYIATGDGGSGGDPFGNGQSLDTLLGKILRIDVDAGAPFAIPPDNPFAGDPEARDEIWAFGLRNPWRFSFDRSTGRLFAGDVGQETWEEIDLISQGGNYGWNVMEGPQCFPPPTSICDMNGLTLPITEYTHPPGGASVTGGYVYRGPQQTALRGDYIFGDFLTGQVWALHEESSGSFQRNLLLDTNLAISSFGEDEEGELYLVHYFGSIWVFLFQQEEALADLSVSKVGTPDPVAVGAQLTYQIEVVNHGPGPATDVVLTDNLPDRASFLSAESDRGSCQELDVAVICTLGDLEEDGRTSIVVVMAPEKPGILVNSVTVAANEADPVLDNNSAIEETTVEGVPDLAITKTHSGTFLVGTHASSILTVSNLGSAPTAGPITVTDEGAPGLHFLSATGESWLCSESQGTVTCTRVETLGAGATSTLILTFLVGPDALPDTTNQASVSLANDVNLLNNSDADTAQVLLLSSTSTTYAQLALGGGFECILLVTNKTNSRWEGTVRLRQGNDGEWNTPWAVNGADASGDTEFHLPIEAKATRKFVLSGDDQARAGYLQLLPGDGFSSQDVTSVLFYNLSDGQRLLESTGTVANPPATGFLFPVEKTTTVNTGLAYAPFLVTTSFKIRLILYDGAGAVVAEEERPNLGHFAGFFSEIFDPIPNGFVGALQVASEQGLFLTVLRLELTEDGFQLTNIAPDRIP